MPAATDTPVVTQTFSGVELVKAGTWPASTGEVTVTREHLAAMVENAADPATELAPIKLGHTDQRFNGPNAKNDGEPGLGWVKNLRLSSDGNTLIGDLVDIPSELANRIRTAFPRRSVEMLLGGERKGVLTGLALLGIQAPAVAGLADVFTATASADTSVVVAVSLTSDTAHIPPADAVSPESQTVPNDTTTPPEGTTMPEPTAPAATETAPAATPPAATTEPAAPAAPADPATQAPTAEAAPVAAATAPTLPPGTVLVDAGVLAQLTAGAQDGVAARAELDKNRRDGIITAALSDGQITPDSAEKVWRPQLDKDEAGTVALLSTLPKNTVPVAPLGHGNPDGTDPLDTEWAALSASFVQEG